MTSTDQLDLDAIEAVVRNAAAIGADIDPGTAAALVAEVRRLRAELAKEEHRHGETIDDRDRLHDMADKLAYAVAPEEVIGEHSSMNCPWENALDLITPAAKVDKLRQQMAGVTALCDAAEKQATRWEHPLPVPEWVAEVRRALNPAARSAAV
ncbi:hypothetical protein ACFC8N_42630 [Streptomyces sp. NPDC055966]|uniref:hypothetical protein n=1 Tax=Streptomyces sp. NPDC055966 TaxID=3345669 RepID=UPI0035DDF88E